MLKTRIFVSRSGRVAIFPRLSIYRSQLRPELRMICWGDGRDEQPPYRRACACQGRQQGNPSEEPGAPGLQTSPHLVSPGQPGIWKVRLHLGLHRSRRHSGVCPGLWGQGNQRDSLWGCFWRNSAFLHFLKGFIRMSCNNNYRSLLRFSIENQRMPGTVPAVLVLFRSSWNPTRKSTLFASFRSLVCSLSSSWSKLLPV